METLPARRSRGLAASVYWIFAASLVCAWFGCAYEPAAVPPGSAGSGATPASGGSSVTGGESNGGGGGVMPGAGTGGSTGGTGTGGVSGGGGSDTGGGPAQPTNPNLTFTKLTLHERFLAEAVAIGDFNQDGTLDIAAGMRWYAGPFTETYDIVAGEHIYRNGHEDLPTTGEGVEIDTGVSDSWAAYSYDMNGDGWDDIIQVSPPDMEPRRASETQGIPLNGDPINLGTAVWFQNPQNAAGNWQEFEMGSSDVKGEHKAFADITGDGKPELAGSCKNCDPIQSWGYWEANWADPTAPWTFHPVTRTYGYNDGCCGWLHGLGLGDVDGDSKLDLLERSGVWLQPATLDMPWTFLNFAMSIPEFLGTEPDIGGGHMFAYDVDADGLNDVITSLHSHGFGLAWFKQEGDGAFTRQMIMNTPEEAATYNNIAVSQLHSLCLEDMDGDGLKDIVTGKTFLAHPYPTGDPGGNDPVEFYVFKLVRDPAAHFVPYLVDEDTATAKAAGGGREFKVRDMNADGLLDIIVASKRGLFVYLGKP